MSDTWRPFTIRRTIGGDVVRATGGWQGALRFGPVHVPFDIVEGTTVSGIPYGYDATRLTVSVPPSVPWQEAVLVRGAFGPPTTPLDGVAVWYYKMEQADFPLEEQFNRIVMDQPLTDGYWYYYTLFLSVGKTWGVDSWLSAATTQVLVPRNYGHASKLFWAIPEFYQRTDDMQAADGRNGPLRKFAAIIGYDADYNRTLLDGVLNVYDPDLAPLKFIELLGTNLGLPIEHALGGARYRTLVGQLWDLEGIRGTIPGLQAFIYAASNYECDVVQGNNQLLATDDSEFMEGMGHWQMFTNSLITSIKNYFSGISPPADAYTYAVVRPYTGTLSPPLPMVSFGGRGIFEVVDISAKSGTAGQPGSVTGGPYNNLSALRNADPPVIASPSTPWLSGDYIVLGDSSHAYWDGDSWEAGEGTVARPPLTAIVAGTPGYFQPSTAQRPYSLADLNLSLAQPATGWSTGQYVLLGDGTHAYLSQNPATGALSWATGEGTLATTAPTSASVPAPGTAGVWYAGSTQVAAPANLTALKAITPMPIPSGTLPWNPTTQYMVLADGTKVSFVGTVRSVNPTGGASITVTRPVATPTLNIQNDTAWTELTRAANADTNRASLAGGTGDNANADKTPIAVPAGPGWSRITFTSPTTQAGIWSDVGNTHTTLRPNTAVPGMYVDVIAMTASPNPAFPDGTRLAVRMNGTEYTSIGVGGAGQMPSGSNQIILAGELLNIPANADIEAWIYNPTASALSLRSFGYSITTWPFFRLSPWVALPMGGAPAGDFYGQGWTCPVTDAYYVKFHAETTSSKPYFYICVNGKVKAKETWGADNKADASWSGTINAGEIVTVEPWNGYAPASVYVSRIANVSPKLEIYRWATV